MNQETFSALSRFDALPDCAFVKMQVVQALRGGISQKSVYDLINAGEIPRPIKLGARLNGWRVGDLRQHLSDLADRHGRATGKSDGGRP